MAKKNDKAKSLFKRRFKRVEPVLQGDTYHVPVPAKLLAKCNPGDSKHFYWTEVDGVLQLTASKPVMAIPVLVGAFENAFEAQSNDDERDGDDDDDDDSY